MMVFKAEISIDGLQSVWPERVEANTSTSTGCKSANKSPQVNTRSCSGRARSGNVMSPPSGHNEQSAWRIKTKRQPNRRIWIISQFLDKWKYLCERSTMITVTSLMLLLVTEMEEHLYEINSRQVLWAWFRHLRRWRWRRWLKWRSTVSVCLIDSSLSTYLYGISCNHCNEKEFEEEGRHCLVLMKRCRRGKLGRVLTVSTMVGWKVDISDQERIAVEEKSGKMSFGCLTWSQKSPFKDVGASKRCWWLVGCLVGFAPGCFVLDYDGLRSFVHRVPVLCVRWQVWPLEKTLPFPIQMSRLPLPNTGN